jgi:hypothetical protein
MTIHERTVGYSIIYTACELYNSEPQRAQKEQEAKEAAYCHTHLSC